MTRREFMEKNHPDVVGDRFRGGVIGCPGTYLDLVDIDPSTAGLRSPKCGMEPECAKCWDQEIPGTKKTVRMDSGWKRWRKQ